MAVVAGLLRAGEKFVGRGPSRRPPSCQGGPWRSEVACGAHAIYEGSSGDHGEGRKGG